MIYNSEFFFISVNYAKIRMFLRRLSFREWVVFNMIWKKIYVEFNGGFFVFLKYKFFLLELKKLVKLKVFLFF